MSAAKKTIIDLLPSAVYLNLKWYDFVISENQQWKRLQEQRSQVSCTGHSFKGMIDTKSIFVHTPKCAGVSISEALYGNLGGGHTTLHEYLYVFSPREVKRFFKFTFVRNPWDRLFSAYMFLRQGGWGENDRSLYESQMAEYKSFDEFVRKWINRNNIWEHHHVFRPQTHYIIDSRNKIKLDFIGRFEKIQQDFLYVCSELNLITSLPKINGSGNMGAYRDYYSQESRDIVKRIYEEDIDVLKYSF